MFVKIVQLSTSLGGGAGIAARRLNSALNEIGLDSKIIAIGKSSEGLNSSEFLLKRNLLTQFQSSLNTLAQYNLIQSGSNLITTNSISTIDFENKDIQDADILHIHSMYNFLNDNDITQVFNSEKKIFFTLHDQRLFTGGCHYSLNCNNFTISCKKCPQVRPLFQSRIEYSFGKRLKTFTSCNSFGIVSPSVWLAKSAESSLILKDCNVSVILNPVPKVFSEFDTIKSKEKLGIPKNVLTIIFIAADLRNPNKGLKTLLDAIKILKLNKNRELKLILVGSNAGTDLDHETDIEIVKANSDEEIALIMAASDVLVVPSRIDNSPNVIGEALMSGLSVLGAETGGITELMKTMDFPTFPAGESKKLAQLLYDFRLDYDRQKIKTKANKMFSYASIGNKIKDMYTS